MTFISFFSYFPAFPFFYESIYFPCNLSFEYSEFGVLTCSLSKFLTHRSVWGLIIVLYSVNVVCRGRRLDLKSLMCAEVRAVSCHDFVANVRICLNCLQLTHVCETIDNFTFKITYFQMLEVTSFLCRGHFLVPRFLFIDYESHVSAFNFQGP